MELKNINIPVLMKKYNVIGMGLALIDGQQISTAEGYGVLSSEMKLPVNNQTLFNACSISKFVTAVLAIKLAEMQLVELDEDVNNKLISWKVPNSKLTNEKKVTLRLLLSHQSGIKDPEGSFAEYSVIDGVPNMIDILSGNTSYCKEQIVVSNLPGSQFSYSDAGYCIIQQLIEDVVGMPFEKAVEEHIFKPLGLKNCIYASDKSVIIHKNRASAHDKYGKLIASEDGFYPYPAAAGLWVTPSDLAILVIEMMNTLKGNSKIGFSITGVEGMISSQGIAEWAGLGVFLEHSNNELEISSLGWGKGYQCMMAAFPYSGSGAIIMTNTDLGIQQMQGMIGELYRNLILT